jgi:hypothetical protein
LFVVNYLALGSSSLIYTLKIIRLIILPSCECVQALELLFDLWLSFLDSRQNKNVGKSINEELNEAHAKTMDHRSSSDERRSRPAPMPLFNWNAMKNK